MYQSDDSRYSSLRESAVWNGIVPDRFPKAIARPSERAEVAPLVADAYREGRRIAIKSGGHNWLGACLRDDSLLLDFGDLNQVEIDADNLIARVEPGATHKVLAEAIVPHGLGFPIGHCATVGLGGYLLAGGYGWNPRNWGTACWSVEAIDAVTVEGEELLIDEDSHSDLFWAARGGGGGFPAIATRYHLRLKPLPKIASVRTDFPLAKLPEILAWSAGVSEMDPGVEVSLIAHRPIDRVTGARLAPVTTVQATGFGETSERANELALQAADAVRGVDDLIDRRSFPNVALDDLEGEGAWVEGLRYSVDMCWTADEHAEVGKACERAIAEAPSEMSRIVFAWGFAPDAAPDVAQTANGTLTVNVYSIWDEPAGDADNIAWTHALMDEIEPQITGFYAGESDLAISADRPRRCYPPQKWERLTEIRDRYDPERRKLSYISEA